MIKGPRILALDRASSPKGTAPTLSNGPGTFGCSAKGLSILYKCLKVNPEINSLSKALDHQTATQLLKLAHKYKPEKKRKEADYWLGLRTKLPAKGMSPPKGYLFFKQGLILSPLIENKKALLVVTAHDMDSTELAVFLPALCCKMGVSYWITKGKARLGHLVHRKTCTTITFTQVSPEDKGTPHKLMVAMWNTYNDRYGEIHWGGNILGPESVTHIANLERAKAKELATKLG